jgi:hypothetical protein
MSITERTIKAHLTSVYNKLGVDSRVAVIVIAAQKGVAVRGIRGISPAFAGATKQAGF